MSVIFETLQKLKHAPVETDTDAANGRPRRNVYAMNKVLMSPVSVAFLALLVFGLGYGLVSGLRQLQRSAQMDPAVLAAARTSAAEAAVAQPPIAEAAQAPIPVAPPGQPGTASAEIPPPDVRHLEPTETAEPTPPAEAPAFSHNPVRSGDSRSEVSIGATYTPPAAGGMVPPVATGSVSIPAGGPSSGASFSIQTAQFNPAAPPQRTAFSEAAGTAVQAAPGYQEAPPLPSDNGYLANLPVTFAAMPASAAVAMPATTDVFPASGADSKHTSTADAEAQTERLGFRRSPIPRYTRLVQRLQTAVVAGDQPEADQLLDEFAAAKGSQHPYIAKIKAYRLLQAGDFAAAEALLTRVLALDEADRDAQVNMVVVEASTGRTDAARQRIDRLVARFPEDETVAAMSRQLN